MLSEDELISKLQILKHYLSNFDFSLISNVIFINVEAFYSFINQFTDNISLSDILIDIEPYIPLSLCVDNDTLDIYIKACASCSESEIKKLEEKFYKKARFNFINKIVNSNTEEQWQQIVNSCKTLYNNFA